VTTLDPLFKQSLRADEWKLVPYYTSETAARCDRKFSGSCAVALRQCLQDIPCSAFPWSTLLRSHLSLPISERVDALAACCYSTPPTKRVQGMYTLLHIASCQLRFIQLQER
jgi:hypothetical protein